MITLAIITTLYNHCELSDHDPCCHPARRLEGDVRDRSRSSTRSRRLLLVGVAHRDGADLLVVTGAVVGHEAVRHTLDLAVPVEHEARAAAVLPGDLVRHERDRAVGVAREVQDDAAIEGADDVGSRRVLVVGDDLDQGSLGDGVLH